MRLITAYTIRNNYPENILISAEQDGPSGQWKVSVYLTKNGDLHSLLLSTKPCFDYKGAAENHAKVICESIVKDKSLHA
ncbi:MAG: hypothetical protein WC756_03680 [Taibaiella sp.]|jgi:hypothetical protein